MHVGRKINIQMEDSELLLANVGMDECVLSVETREVEVDIIIKEESRKRWTIQERTGVEEEGGVGVGE